MSLLEYILPSMNRDQIPILDIFSVPLGNVSQNVNDNSIVLSVVKWFLINKPQQVLETANGIESGVTFPLYLYTMTQ